MPGYALVPALDDWSPRLQSRCLRAPGSEEPHLLTASQVASVLTMPDQYERRVVQWPTGSRATVCLGPLDGWTGVVVSQRGDVVRLRLGRDTEVSVSSLSLE